MPKPDERAGVELLRLLVEPREWVRRRVETIRFTGEGEARRSVSVDFIVPDPITLSSDPRTGRPWAGQRRAVTLIPLALLQKKPLTLLDVATDDGRSRPVLDTVENGYLAWSSLVVAARSALGWSSDELLPLELLKLTYSIAREPTPKAIEALANLEVSDNQDIQLARQNPGFRKLVYDLSQNFVLLIEGDDLSGGQRRIAKYSYAVDFSEAGLTSIGSWRQPHVKQFIAEIPAVANAASYHVQLVPPTGASVADSALRVADSITSRIQETHCPRIGGIANVNINNVPWGSSAEVRVNLALSHKGLLTTGVLATAAIVLLSASLASISFWHDSVIKDLHNEGDATLAALLAVPGLIAGYLARGGEPSLLARLLRPVRALLLLSSVTMYIAAISILLVTSKTAQSWILFSVFMIGASCFALTLRWWFGCRRISQQ